MIRPMVTGGGQSRGGGKGEGRGGAEGEEVTVPRVNVVRCFRDKNR